MRYDYRCLNCKSEFEYERGSEEPDPEHCSKCGGGNIKRLFTTAGIVFKGKGFYQTDTRT